MAAAIIFSSILISNFTLVSGEQQKFRLVSLSVEERELGDRASVLGAGATVRLLDAAQMEMSSRTFDCPEAGAEVEGLTQTLRTIVRGPGVQADARLSPGPAASTQDDAPGVQPFNGSSTDSVSFESVVYLSGASPDSSVSIRLNESHVVSVPVRVASLAATCLSAFGTVMSSLQGLGAGTCNSTSVALLMASLDTELADYARAAGFASSLSYWTSGGAGCSVGFTIVMWQDGIQGPAGPFRFTVSESGSL